MTEIVACHRCSLAVKTEHVEDGVTDEHATLCCDCFDLYVLGDPAFWDEGWDV